MNKICVSIIMPAYNAQKYIKESIDSVLNQSFGNFELIVVNDGSIDKTEEIVKSYNDERIVLISQKNGGVSSARNRALEIAKGKYITFLDADDIFPKESLQKRYDYLEENPDVDLVDGIVKVKDENLEKTLRKYAPYYKGELLPELLKLNDRVFLGNCYMFKKEKLKDTRFKENMTHGEDLLFFITLASKSTINYGYINTSIMYYRSGHGSAMANLQGLENGYIELLQEIRLLQCASLLQMFFLKFKVIKIMFLSWLGQKEYFNAVKSICKILI